MTQPPKVPTNVCEHGQLERSCEICELRALIRERERQLGVATRAMRSVRERLHCTKMAPFEYDADHSCASCGHSSAYEKDVIDEAFASIGDWQPMESKHE